LSAASGDRAGANAGGVRERNSLAVMRVEYLYLQRCSIGLREQCNDAWCYGSVHVHEQDLYLLGSFSYGW